MPHTQNQVTAAVLKDVELMRPGTWKLASGEQTFEEKHLYGAERYANRAGARPSPIKIGHTDQRFVVGDGEPALGWLGNLRVKDDDGLVLVGDITGMPDWLAAAAPDAWPDRSVEGWLDFTAEDGEEYPFVIDALALLGVQPPGVGSLKSLRDLPQLVGVAASARRVIARAPQTTAPEAEEPMKEGTGMDPAKIREALGLPADASDDEVGKAVAAAFPVAEPPPLFDVGAPAPVAAKQQPGTIVLASSVWDETQKTIKTLTDFVNQTKRSERDSVIAQAVVAGKFTPAQKPHFSKLWDADPDGTRALIDTLMPNSALAVMASGYAGEAEQNDLDREFEHLFPPTATKGA